jgi:Zn-dependent protease with chaperone function
VESNQHALHTVRFGGDLELFEQLSREDLADRLTQAGFEQHRQSIRKRLLSSAVRVDPRMLPKLDASIRALKRRANYEEHFEAYVFEGTEINAFLTRGEKHTFLGLSSGAINVLSEAELEFVIGHELGHALFQHIDAAFTTRLQDERLENRLQKRLLAWKRASEISADRCGLVCCGSLDAAARRTLPSSGTTCSRR